MVQVCRIRLSHNLSSRNGQRERERGGWGGGACKVMKDGWSEGMYTKREIGITPPGIRGGWVALWGFPLAKSVFTEE